MESVLSEQSRRKLDAGDDSSFYDSPRFVTHADEAFLDRLTTLYETVLEPGATVFDAMSSWVSHLPDDEFDTVVGHGLNREELAANDTLDEWFCQDLNTEQSLPLADDQFDAVLCALSVQYLQYPAAVFAEFARVLSPTGTLVVSFTNRMFATKAIRAWRTRSMEKRLALVRSYCEAGGLSVTRTVSEQPGTDPFVAVLATPDE